jgi:hypothetical protein
MAKHYVSQGDYEAVIPTKKKNLAWIDRKNSIGSVAERQDGLVSLRGRNELGELVEFTAPASFLKDVVEKIAQINESEPKQEFWD